MVPAVSLTRSSSSCAASSYIGSQATSVECDTHEPDRIALESIHHNRKAINTKALLLEQIELYKQPEEGELCGIMLPGVNWKALENSLGMDPCQFIVDNGASLEYINLEGADLSGANFKGRNLEGANLSMSNLTDAKFDEHTNLSESDLRAVEDADFSAITEEHFRNVLFISDDGSVNWPMGADERCCVLDEAGRRLPWLKSVIPPASMIAAKA